MESTSRQLQARIRKIQEQINQLGELRPGSLSRQYNVCGKPACRCKEDPPRKHGPYYQLSFTHRGKNTTEFVRREDLPRVRKQIQNYKRLRSLVDQWIDATIRSDRNQRKG